MTILFLAESSYILRKSTHQYDLITHIGKNQKSTLICTNNWEEKKETIVPDVVYLVDCNVPYLPIFWKIIPYYKRLGKPIALICDDAFYIKKFINHPNIKPLDAIIFMKKMDRLKEQYKKVFPNKLIFSLDKLFVNTKKFKPHPSIQKEYDITIYGTLNHDAGTCLNAVDDLNWDTNKDIPEKANFYPLRHRVSQLLFKNNDRYKINHISPSGSFDAKIYGENLSKEIAKSYLGLATRSRTDKCMEKYLEISSSGTVVLGNIPTDYRDFFEGNMIEITDEMKDEEILQVIDRALENKQLLENISSKFPITINNNCGPNNPFGSEEFSKIHVKIMK